MPPHGVVPATRIARRRVIWAGLGALACLVPGVARADSFDINFTVDRSGGGPVRINGRVRNEGHVDVYDVYVTAEALDGNGKVLGRGIAFVASSVPSRATVPFMINIPASADAARFRVRVSSFRHGLGQQAG
jgi:hypothetical protein